MKVFEDLVVELKEHNLLENTVIEADPSAGGEAKYGKPRATTARSMTTESAAELAAEMEAAPAAPAAASPEDQPPRKPRNGAQFYKKRAIGELANLQMVEHVLTGVEREHMKIVPNVFDDFAAKKALNTFLQIAENENTERHAEAEFSLMNETESWCLALAERDAKVPVSNLRLYCENSRPPLSSQALVALARFYRNLPYTEVVRAKFDFVMTRLFSRPTEQGLRVNLFSRGEILSHINTMYGEWSSIALYSAGDNESDSVLAALSFEDLAVEAENTSTFDYLVASGFFGRLRIFKESISELFYAPHVTAAAIECNVRVGNAYVTLLSRERERFDAESLETKYGGANDQEASDAAGHTLDLVGILNEARQSVEAAVEEIEVKNIPTPEMERLDANALTATRVIDPVAAPKAVRARRPFFGNILENARAINKWFLGISIALIALSFGIYIWSNVSESADVTTSGVKTVPIANGVAHQHVNTARISGTTFYALMHPSWDQLPKEERMVILKAIYQTAVDRGCKQVQLTDRQGRAAGYASATRTDVIMP